MSKYCINDTANQGAGCGVGLVAKRRAILLAIGTLLMFRVFYGLPSEFSVYVDDQYPFAVLAMWAEYRNPDVASKYPVLHSMILTPIYTVIYAVGLNGVGIESSYPFGLRNPNLTFTVMNVVTRLVSLLMLLGASWLVLRGMTVGAGARTMLLFVLAPVTAFYSVTGNLDVPYVAWLLVLTYYSLSELNGARFVGNRQILLLSAASAAAVLTKDQAVFYVAGLHLGLIVYRRITLLQGLSVALLAVGIYLLVSFIGGPERFLAHLDFWLRPTAVYKDFAQVGHTIEGYSYLLYKTLWYVLIDSGVLLLMPFIRLNKSAKIIMIALAIYWIGTVGATRIVYPRFVIPIIAGLVLVAILSDKRKHYVPALNAILTLVAVKFIVMAYVYYEDPKHRLHSHIEKNYRQGTAIKYDGGLTGYPLYQTYTNYRIVAEAKSRFMRHAVADASHTPKYELMEMSADTISKDAIVDTPNWVVTLYGHLPFKWGYELRAVSIR